MLIPVGVVVYVLVGGMRASLLADYIRKSPARSSASEADHSPSSRHDLLVCHHSHVYVRCVLDLPDDWLAWRHVRPTRRRRRA